MPSVRARCSAPCSTTRSLLWQFARREISGRYRGSLIGFGWAVLSPLLLLAIYTFVFSIVFRIRWDGPVADRTGFALVVYTGMIVHGFFAECMTRAPTLIVDNRNLVKKVVFPLQLLPWSVLAVAAFHFAVGIVLIAAAHADQDRSAAAVGARAAAHHRAARAACAWASSTRARPWASICATSRRSSVFSR